MIIRHATRSESKNGGPKQLSEAAETVYVPPMQYRDADQQRDSAEFGMWIFLSTELLLFGGLFVSYIVCRYSYSSEFSRYSHDLNAVIGTVNTAVLIVSSVAMATASFGARTASRFRLLAGLSAAAMLGTVFLGLKAYEYYQHYVHNDFPGLSFDAATHGKQIFFFLYFAMTGLHAIHLTVGVGIVSFVLYGAFRRDYSPVYFTPIENAGLYWHFVDVIWIFLYPLFYLIDLHK
jgi:cytochrome c oxidase subunit 3